jgi:hypothetical protein
MRFRKLRIAWSVFCGLACVLLVALWVRSYYLDDKITLPVSSSDNLHVLLLRGKIVLTVQENAPFDGRWSWNEHDVASYSRDLSSFDASVPAWRLNRGNASIGYVLPYYCPVLLSVFLAAAPWMRLSKRFTTRTLLIATTLVAVALGFMVWLVAQ